MSNKEKLQIENNRTIDNINVIYLFKDGGSAWYSAYEWSAYLMEFFPNDLPDNKRLKPTHRIQKDIDNSYIKVGLQLPSLQKYVPNIQVQNVNENIVILKINLYNDLSFNNYIEKLQTWKDSVKIKDTPENSEYTNKTTNKSNNVFNNPITFVQIMKQIISYDTYDKNEEDLREFILKLKHNCANIIC